MNVFTLKPEEYKRNYDILNEAISDTAFYLSVQTGDSLQDCREYVEKQIAKGGQFEINDPEVLCLSKETPGNRDIIPITFTEYIKDVCDKEWILSPTMAVYENPKVKRSILAQYIAGNIARRSAVKKEQHAAMMAKDKVLEAYKESQQTTFKIKNNSLSGAHASPFTILYNKSSHSSLTSTCRSATSYGNANNEKFITGNRHYWSPAIVRNNIISIVNHTDYQAFAGIVEKYNIYLPSHDDVMDVIHYSTDLYWSSDEESEKLRTLVSKLKPLQRAAFVYTGDLYHLAKYNDSLVRRLLTDFSKTPTHIISVEETDALLPTLDADLRTYVNLLRAKELDGETIKELRAKPFEYGLYGATAKNINYQLQEWSDLIRTLWVTLNVPSSIAKIPDSIRRAAVTSDTDSTIFTVQNWVEWYTGKIGFDDESMAINYTIVYLASQTIIHILAILSANMGVITEQMHQLAMKNEFSFPVFALTPRAKHYYAYQAAKEGNVFKKPKLEVKGVALRNANCPAAIMAQARGLIMKIMDDIMSKGEVSAEEVLGIVAKVELEIKNSILNGGFDHMPRGRINTPESYSAGVNNATYKNYGLWEEVFAPKYGHTEPPVYAVVKASLDTDNKTKLKAWLDSMEDKALAERMRTWLTKNGRDKLTNILLPLSVISGCGVPKEVVQGVNIRKLVYSTMEAFYLILESLGIYMINDDLTNMVSDRYNPI